LLHLVVYGIDVPEILVIVSCFFIYIPLLPALGAATYELPDYVVQKSPSVCVSSFLPCFFLIVDAPLSVDILVLRRRQEITTVIQLVEFLYTYLFVHDGWRVARKTGYLQVSAGCSGRIEYQSEESRWRIESVPRHLMLMHVHEAHTPSTLKSYRTADCGGCCHVCS
jgi:hypothetical protein